MDADSADSIVRLAARRAAVRDSFRSALTSEQTASHRRLLNGGRLAQARAVIEQAERFFLAAHDALGSMNECELEAFERVMALDCAAGLHQVVAAVLLRSDREVRHRQISLNAATCGSASSREASMTPGFSDPSRDILGCPPPATEPSPGKAHRIGIGLLVSAG